MARKRSEVMMLTSAAFAHGRNIPSRFTCDGDDLSPPLAWSGVPSETRSYAVVCHDPDAPSGDWLHWAAFDIAAGTTSLPEGVRPGRPPFREAINDFGKIGYGGPCPPQGHGRHHYHFKLFALDVARLDVPAKVRCREIVQAAEAHALATAELIGIYSRT